MMPRTFLPPNSPKCRWKSTYRPRTPSQNARFCESNAPTVITGSSRSSSQCTPSLDLRARNPSLPLPASALYSSPGRQSGLASLNGAKLCEPYPSQMILFFFDPPNSTIPSSGFSQFIPSRLSA